MRSSETAHSAAAAIKGKVDEFVIIASAKSSVMIKYANGEITVSQSWKEHEIMIYVTKGRKINVSVFTSPTPQEALAKVPDIVEKLPDSPLYAPLPAPSGSPISIVDPAIREASETGDASKLLSSIDVSKYGNVAGMISFSHVSSHYLSSNGLDAGYEVTSSNGYFRVFRGDDSGQWSWVSTTHDASNIVATLEKSEELAELCASLPKEKIEPGTYRVLLSPMVAGNLLERVADATSAGAVLMGMSFFQGVKPGELVASERLSIYDVPRAESLPSVRGFDDEGMTTRDKALIEKGVFKGFVHNSKTARLMGEESTGNAGLVLPRVFSIEVGAGSLSSSELMESLWNGIYATNNWYTRFQNYIEGSFSTVTRDALILVRNGKPVSCSRRARLVGSMRDMIKDIEELSRERWKLMWWEIDTPSIVPYVLLKKIYLSSV